MSEEPAKHPSLEEYSDMDKVRFPFAFKLSQDASDGVKKYWKSKKQKRGRVSKVEERINKLIDENVHMFMCPIFKVEVHPTPGSKIGGNSARKHT